MARSRELRVQVVGDTRGLTRAFGSADNAARRFGDGVERSSGRASAAMSGMARAAGAAGLAIGAAGVGAAIVSTVKVTVDFEKKLSSLRAVTNANAREMERFRKQALQAGLDTAFSAREAAQAQTELAKGGLSVAQIMKGGLKSALALAAAGELDLGDAATYTVNAMKLFNLRGKDTMRVADGLAQAANSTTADVADFGMALTQGGTAAKAAGLDFKETVTVLEALAQIGVKNSDAGTSLKTALMQLAAPTDKAQSLMKELNLEFFDARGNFKDLDDVSAMLQDRFKGLTKEQRLQAAGTLVGRDGMRTLLALYDAGPDKLRKWERQLGKSGTAAEVAKKKQDNLAGAWEQFTGALETAQIEVGTKLLPVFTKVVKWGTRFVEQMVKGKGAGGDFVDTLKDIGDTLADIWGVAKKIPPEVYALMGITVAGVKANKMLGGLPGKALGGLGSGLAGKVASKATPVPVWVMNPGFGGPGGGGKPGLLDKASRVAPIAAAGARIVPVVGAAGILYYVFSKSNRNLPTGAGEPTRRSADRTPSGGRNVGEDLAPSPNATRKVEGMGDALKRMAARARDLIPTVHKSTENLKGFRSAADKGADAANRNSKRLGNLKDSSNGFRGAAAKAVDTANRLRDRIEAMGGAARRGDTNVGRLKSELAGLKDKTVKLKVSLAIAADDFTLEPFGATGRDGPSRPGPGAIQSWVEERIAGNKGVRASIRNAFVKRFTQPQQFIGGKGSIVAVGRSLQRAGFMVGEHPAFGGVGAVHVPGSAHYSGRAIDVNWPDAATEPQHLDAILGSLRRKPHSQIIWRNRDVDTGYPIGGHMDHLHFAMQRGGTIPGSGSGDKVLVAAEPGEGFINKRAVAAMGGGAAIDALNRLVPRFQKGGKVGPGGIPRTDWRMVKSIASRYGVDPLLLVAIGKIETDWGRLGDGRNGNVLGVGSYDTGSSYQWAGLRNQLRKGSELLKSWGATTLDAVVGGKASSWATDPGWESAVASKYREIATPHWARNAQVIGDDDAGGGGTSGGISWTTKGGRVGKKTRLPEGTTFFKSGAGVRVKKGRIVARTEASAAGRERWRNRPTLGGTYTYESELAQADRILDRAGDIDPTNKRDVAAVGGKLLLLGNRKAAIKRRLRTIRKALKGRLSRARRSRLLGEQAQLISELGGIESTSRELHESMHPEAGEDTAAQAAEDRAAAQRELADQIKALKESIDEQNRITSSTVAIGLREAQRALADMISGEIGGLVGQRNRSPGDGVTAARY